MKRSVRCVRVRALLTFNVLGGHTLADDGGRICLMLSLCVHLASQPKGVEIPNQGDIRRGRRLLWGPADAICLWHLFSSAFSNCWNSGRQLQTKMDEFPDFPDPGSVGNSSNLCRLSWELQIRRPCDEAYFTLVAHQWISCWVANLGFNE